MDSKEYTKRILQANYKTYIDTSALMDVDYLKLLVENMELELVAMNKKITVPRAVWMEILRHMESDNPVKREKATYAFDAICLHQDMFFIEDKGIDRDQIMKAFADKELLALLIRNKTRCGQLLITNDKKLSKDAYSLNQQESCLGYKISVCYLSHEGHLSACECTKAEDPICEDVQNHGENTVDSSVKGRAMEIVIASVVSLGLGFVIGKYGSRVWNCLF